MLKRIGLFLLTNILIMTVVGILLSVFNVGPIANAYGLNYGSLMAFCLIWGMAGSFISLMLSKFMAKRFMGLHEIDENDHRFGYLVKKVHFMAKESGLTKMPEVHIYESSDMNAFATGPSRNNSLVAVSTGLLSGMSEDEVDGVLAHEVAHIANGDMVTMALIQGVMNAFVMFAARVVTFVIDQALRRNDDDGEGLGFFAYMIVYNLLNIVFGIMAAPVVMGFSRWREYRADAGSARIVGKEKMISALRALQRNYEMLKTPEGNMATLSISNKQAIVELFSSHPPLEKRIEALSK